MSQLFLELLGLELSCEERADSLLGDRKGFQDGSEIVHLVFRDVAEVNKDWLLRRGEIGDELLGAGDD